jgi:hypothetical protein
MSVTRGRRSNAEAGQALIETAVVLPLVLILLFLVVDFGIALDRREVIIHSLREAGRSAAAGNEAAVIVGRAVNESDGVLDSSDVTVCYADENVNATLGDAGDVVRVHINYAFGLSIGGGEMLSAAGVPSTIPISPTGEVLLIKDTLETSPTVCPP